MKKAPKDIQHPIHPLLEKRWSPRTFKAGQLSRDELMSVLEAARWAPSSYNEQPWRFIYGLHGTVEFDKIHNCLLSGNQPWTKDCGALLVSLSKEKFDRNGKENRTAIHDVGLAVMSMVVEATHLGYHVHQMGGIDKNMIREVFNIPEGFDPLTIIAIGELNEEETLDGNAESKEFEAQKRKGVDEFAGNGIFVNE